MIERRQITMIESGPWSTQYVPTQFLLATESERQELKIKHPNWIVRIATPDEEQALGIGEVEEVQEEELA